MSENDGSVQKRSSLKKIIKTWDRKTRTTEQHISCPKGWKRRAYNKFIFCRNGVIVAVLVHFLNHKCWNLSFEEALFRLDEDLETSKSIANWIIGV